MRQWFALIINELGTGLAARGSDLNAVIHRANPALGDTDKVFKILAEQNRQLAQLATDSDRVLAPLARKHADRRLRRAGEHDIAMASAAASRGHLELDQAVPAVPARSCGRSMADLGQLADQGTPLMTSLGQSAAALGRQFENLTPFAEGARSRR